jgi:hypothetical protein
VRLNKRFNVRKKGYFNKFAFQINTKMETLLPFRGDGREMDEPVYLPNSLKSYQVWGNENFYQINHIIVNIHCK